MGTHGLSGVDKLLIGSTTERMLRRTSVPVLAVPPSAPERGRQVRAAAIVARARDTGAGGPSGRITAGRSRRGEDRARVRCDAGAGSRRLAVQAPSWYRADVSAGARIRVTKAQRELDSLAKSVGRGVATESRVLTGNPPDEIAAVAAEERIGLVVMHLRKGPAFRIAGRVDRRPCAAPRRHAGPGAARSREREASDEAGGRRCQR